MADLHKLLNKTSPSEKMNFLLSQLPKERWMGEYDLYQWNGSWYFPAHLESTLAVRSFFEARDDDIIIASPPKAGTTWLKALVPTIVNGLTGDKNDDQDPLVTKNPHSIVKSLEGLIYLINPKADLSSIPSPRLFHTHLPYNALPESIKTSKCKIVYIARNPKDTFVSLWHFMNMMRPTEQGPFPLEEAFDSFCKGVHFFGPFIDHVLGFWKESLKMPEKILFLKYEEMKRDPKEHVNKLGSFVGKPFGSDEEIDNVIWRCSIDRLKNLDVNKNGVYPTGLRHSSFFRRGVVGDWKNCFTPEMSKRLDQATRLKLEGSGLDLEI